MSLRLKQALYSPFRTAPAFGGHITWIQCRMLFVVMKKSCDLRTTPRLLGIFLPQDLLSSSVLADTRWNDFSGLTLGHDFLVSSALLPRRLALDSLKKHGDLGCHSSDERFWYPIAWNRLCTRLLRPTFREN